jgi:pyruvate dehydrogenase E1 component alpha subunit
VFCSDGAANHGTFGEALNLAAIWDLPLLLVIENNQYAVSTPIDQSSRVADLHERGRGYGVEGSKIDGNDVVAVYERAAEDRERCLRGEGPILIEAITFRHAGHHVNDPGTYMPQDKLEYYKSRDPLLLCRQHISAAGAVDGVTDAIEAEVETGIEAAIEFARASPEPSVDDFVSSLEAGP